jgi:transcriptional regulator with XRE-family HTH domain
MSNDGFDAQAFYAALDTERVARKKTWRQVANEARVSASTLTRMGQGKRPDVDSLGSLAAWSGLNIDHFVIGKRPHTQIETLTEITALLRTDRNLGPDGAATLEAILKTAYSHLRKIRNENETGI